MRIALILPLVALLAACGVAGDPSHPESKTTFSGSMSVGASRSF